MNEQSIRVLMIYNNTGHSDALKDAWGLSIWIEQQSGAFLFDTGGDAGLLWSNMEVCEIDLSKLKKIAISHNHWDHKNGLPLILEKAPAGTEVFVPESDLGAYREQLPEANITGVTGSRKLYDHIFSTGVLPTSLPGAPYEQSMIVNQNGSVYIFTGCSHPGIVRIVKKTRDVFPDKKIALAAGGFHLMRKSKNEIKEISAELKQLGVEKLAASHCTGDKAISYFRDDWGERFLAFDLGDEMTTLEMHPGHE